MLHKWKWVVYGTLLYVIPNLSWTKKANERCKNAECQLIDEETLFIVCERQTYFIFILEGLDVLEIEFLVSVLCVVAVSLAP